MKKSYQYKGSDELKHYGIQNGSIRKITSYPTKICFTALVELDKGNFENVEYKSEEEFKKFWEEIK